MSSENHFPPADGQGTWAQTKPENVGFDPEKLGQAIAFAEAHESPWPRDLEDSGSVPGLTQIEPEPWNKFLGVLKPRGGPAGMLVRHGEIAATWGDPSRIDMTFSIAKSYLAVLAGLAVDDGLIKNIDAPVCETIDIAEFSGDQNRKTRGVIY